MHRLLVLVESHHHTKVCRAALATGAEGSLKNSSQNWAIFSHASALFVHSAGGFTGARIMEHKSREEAGS